MKRIVLVLLIACLSCAAMAQEKLTNESVLKMVKAGLSDELIINIIRTQPAKFSLTTDNIIVLKQAGVSDKVLGAMVDKNAPPAPPAAATLPAPSPVIPPVTAGAAKRHPASPGATAVSPVSEPGVYYRKDGKWTPLVPELVTWKSGGVLQAIRTAGRGREMTGRVEGASSSTSVNTPLEVLIHTPAEEEAHSYELFRLRERDGTREFRALGNKPGKDAVALEAHQTAPRTFEATVRALPAGEYGILAIPQSPPPGAQEPARRAAQPNPAQPAAPPSKEAQQPQVSKLYTFHVRD